MRILAFLLAFVAVAQPPGGVFESALWPGEGRPQFHAAATDLVIREMPSASARIASRLRVSKGQEIAFDETRYRTIERGRLQVLSTTKVSGRVLGSVRLLTPEAYYKGAFPHEVVDCKEGDNIEYLQYRAEGTCFVRIRDQVVDADPCPAQNEQQFRVITQPTTEWWIRVVRNGTPVGWLMVEDKTVDSGGRLF